MRYLLLLDLVFFTNFVLALEPYSPYVDRTYPVNVYWGDTHLHSSMSVDSNLLGNKRLMPAEAYKFARGEVVIANNGMKAKLRRPLDFLLIADHAENLGLMVELEASSPQVIETAAGENLVSKLNLFKSISDPDEKLAASLDFQNLAEGKENRSNVLQRSIWHRVTATADLYNDPGIFTALIGYEWTSIGSQGGFDNLHRVVVFKDDASVVSQVLPFSRLDSDDTEELWSYLESYENKTGGEVFAIPHNGNLSNGEMFSEETFSGRGLTTAYAKARNRWEPLYEVVQTKGSSESHPVLSPTDEFSNYEIWNSWLGNNLGREWDEAEINKKKHEYARPALKLGIEYASQLGVNPFKFGLIGSTDSHTSLATADDNNYWGKLTNTEPSPKRVIEPVFMAVPGWDIAAAGYAGVWAEENTRESLFAAMKRKETYASTGPRMTVRFFGGWDYQPNDAFKPDFAHLGYRKGVPMGGDLAYAPAGKAPNFLIRAVKDPDGANLDRVQVIKGWLDTKGGLHEKIYNVALSDNRKTKRSGKAKPVGSTVNIKQASYTNTIGAAELSVVWNDPDFKADEYAFYYVRVLEIPTPRWTAYDAKYFQIKDIPAEVPMVTQERAYTSPIWYSPSIQTGTSK